ncbi:hypothetical protein [Pseudarthrobacter albicanus]|uniref:hypothetical protein n=1 Tax=Pseudarthrobacter albicanus TaxID=2823873 RepID=UPI001BA7429E|nr:hypothetical protein [Pseudarthrobacter albicanus]
MAEGDIQRGGWEPAISPSWTSPIEGVIGVGILGFVLLASVESAVGSSQLART